MLARLGWRPRIVPYPGYGSMTWVRVLARTVLSPKGGLEGPAVDTPAEARSRGVRGWRAMATAEVAGTEVLIRAGGVETIVRSERGGYIDTVVPAAFEPGWHDVELVVDGRTVAAPVLVVHPEARAGIVSDIDDTIMITSVPRPLLAAWNTFVLHESARRPVDGMAELYRAIQQQHGADPARCPVVYVSTGSWNSVPGHVRFASRNGYPVGPFLLTDWGPTNTGFFRSGSDHKRQSMRRVMEDFPQISWTLVGDDGQHDPSLYAEAVADLAEHVAAVAIRTLSPAQQTLSHGLPAPVTDTDRAQEKVAEHGVPFVVGPDGFALREGLSR